jgi:response regulator RpfG family c-di-GMP phosphodiesterase
MNKENRLVKVLVVQEKDRAPITSIKTLDLNNLKGIICGSTPEEITAGLNACDIDIVICEEPLNPENFSVINFLRGHPHSKVRNIVILAVAMTENIVKRNEIYEIGADEVISKIIPGRGTVNDFLCVKINALVRMKRRFGG